MAPATLSVAADTALEKKIQGSRPTNTNKGNGIPWLDTRSRVEKTKDRMSIWLRGFSRAQTYPSTDCLY